jgi:hypothetical protein
VSGSHFSPFFVRHHPLKSTVHRSFGSVGIKCAGVIASPPDSRRRVRFIKPTSCRTRRTVTTDGVVASSGCRFAITVAIFFGPHRMCSFLSCTISSASSADVFIGELCGRRDSSTSPVSPRFW